MSEYRRNPLTGEWVILATKRAERPHKPGRGKKRRAAPDWVRQCPFCPGNERMTPPSILEVPAGPQGWRIRGFENKYPALEPQADLGQTDSPLLQKLGGKGSHEVVVETPLHNSFPASRTTDELELLLHAYRARYRANMDREDILYTVIFKNHGEQAGTSLEHPHSQIIATAVIPDGQRIRSELAEEYYAKTAGCLTCHVAAEEARLGTRVVCENDRFVAFNPFAAVRAAETWICPSEHMASFAESTDEQLASLADALLRTLKSLEKAFDGPDYNYIIHSAPKGSAQEYHHWYLQIMPHLERLAGFELGTGIYINAFAPEETAEMMRKSLP